MTHSGIRVCCVPKDPLKTVGSSLAAGHATVGFLCRCVAYLTTRQVARVTVLFTGSLACLSVPLWAASVGGLGLLVRHCCLPASLLDVHPLSSSPTAEACPCEFALPFQTTGQQVGWVGCGCIAFWQHHVLQMRLEVLKCASG